MSVTDRFGRRQTYLKRKCSFKSVLLSIFFWWSALRPIGKRKVPVPEGMDVDDFLAFQKSRRAKDKRLTRVQWVFSLTIGMVQLTVFIILFAVYSMIGGK